VVSQVGFISGLHNGFRRAPIAQRTALTNLLNKDRAARFSGEAPATLKAVSADPLEPSVMPGQAAHDYFMEQGRIAPNWRNEITLRSIDHLRGLDNSAYLPFISPAPLLMIVALNDELVPADLSIAAYQTALEPKKLVLLPGNHFSPYEEEFSLTGNEARDWLSVRAGKKYASGNSQRSRGSGRSCPLRFTCSGYPRW